MIGNIYNFKTHSSNQTTLGTDVTFSFTKPIGDLGIYKLYYSLNASDYTLAKVVIDKIHSELNNDSQDLIANELNNTIYFNYTIPIDNDGVTIFFKLQAVSSKQELSTFSDVITFYNYTSNIENLSCTYNGFAVNLEWDTLDITSVKNKNFDKYTVSRITPLNLSDTTIENNILYNNLFIKDKHLFVYDKTNKTYWFNKISTTGEFELNNNNRISQLKSDILTVTEVDSFNNRIYISPLIENTYNYLYMTCTISNDSYELDYNIASKSSYIDLNNVDNINEGDTVILEQTIYKLGDNSPEYLPSINNISVYIEDTDSEELLGSVTETKYLDDTYSLNKFYFYTVKTKDTNGYLSNGVIYPIYILDTTKIYPYLRSSGNSDTEMLKRYQWRSMKSELVGDSFYDKDKFSIPYLGTELTNLKGYIGIYDANVDIWVNDKLTLTVKTDKYGEFDINYKFPLGTCYLKIQARDYQNINFTRMTAPIKISTKNIYTFYAILGKELERILDELERIKTDRNMYTARYSSFTQMYAPLIDLYKSIDEDDNDFMDIASVVFNSYEYAGYTKSLIDVLNIFVEKVSEFDNFDIYYNDSLYYTHKTGKAFVVRDSDLKRGKYTYAVSCAKETGEETTPSVLTVDRRWWPEDYIGYNVLMWDENYQADKYNIYRSQNNGELNFLTSTKYNIFVDTDSIPENSEKTVLDYNYSGMEEPSNFIVYNDTQVSNIAQSKLKASHTIIILYGNNSEELPDLQLTRIKQLCAKMIPPEIKYTLIFANDDKVEVLSL